MFLQNLQDLCRPGVIGAWIAPGVCCIGEFKTRKNTPQSIAWAEEVLFSDIETLGRSLQTITKNRWLQGRPIVLGLSTPDIFKTRVEITKDNPIEKQCAVLLPGINLDDIEYSVFQEANGTIVACVRHTDIKQWVGLFESAGLIAGAVVPAGITWSKFFNGDREISCTLSSGVLSSRYDKTWQESVFVPSNADATSGPAAVVFNSPIRPEFGWCRPGMAPVLESLTIAAENPEFNLNLKSYRAKKAKKLENRAATGLFWGTIGSACLIALFAILLGIATLWNHAIVSQKSASGKKPASLSQIKQENRQLEAKLSSYKPILSRRSNTAKIVHDIGKIANDSLWYSAMEFRADNVGIGKVIVTGYSRSESGIAKLLVDAETLAGAKKASLEYTEKTMPDQTAKMTNGRLQVLLYRFKVIFDFSAPKSR